MNTTDPHTHYTVTFTGTWGRDSRRFDTAAEAEAFIATLTAQTAQTAKVTAGKHACGIC